jgi:hypothetical protein
MRLKTATQTKATGVNAVTITSPNTKQIFLKSYLVALYGSAAGTTGLTFQITDEDSNVLWEDAHPAGVADKVIGTGRLEFTFPENGLPVPVGKNLVATLATPGANEASEVNLIYYI